MCRFGTPTFGYSSRFKRRLNSPANMQRLFSTFPGSLPGIGLLILRVCAGLSLFDHAGLGEVASYAGVVTICAVLVGGCLTLGYCTPIASALQGASQVWAIAFASRFDSCHLVLAAVGASVTMLGPGAWSIDARLYGRKRIDIDDRPG